MTGVRGGADSSGGGGGGGCQGQGNILCTMSIIIIINFCIVLFSGVHEIAVLANIF